MPWQVHGQRHRSLPYMMAIYCLTAVMLGASLIVLRYLANCRSRVCSCFLTRSEIRLRRQQIRRACKLLRKAKRRKHKYVQSCVSNFMAELLNFASFFSRIVLDTTTGYLLLRVGPLIIGPDLSDYVFYGAYIGTLIRQ